jgi:hypothetical protein
MLQDSETSAQTTAANGIAAQSGAPLRTHRTAKVKTHGPERSKT